MNYRSAENLVLSLARGAALAALVWAFSLAPSLSQTTETWTTQFTCTGVDVTDGAGVAVVQIMSSTTVMNPAGCAADDSYAVNDVVINGEVMAAALSALASGQPLQILVSTTSCSANNRPEILSIHIGPQVVT